MLKIRRQFLLLAIHVSTLSAADTIDTPFKLSSGETQVALIELFTSEGCSSCPPADRWLSQLKTDPHLWQEFTPIAFHVDYWDYIGWSDEFAQARFGDRQRRYAAEEGARFVYTPGFFRNGSEWHNWRTQDSVTGNKIDVGNLSLQISGEDVVVHFVARRDIYKELILHVAVLGMNIETRVGAGENSGKLLHHDFVAMGITSVVFDKDDKKYRVTLQLPEVRPYPAGRAIVAWVSDETRQTPIQSVGGFFPEP